MKHIIYFLTRVMLFYRVCLTYIFSDILFFVKDMFRNHQTPHLFTTRKGQKFQTRKDVQDRAEVALLYSGHEYGALIPHLKKLQKATIIDAGANIGAFGARISNYVNIDKLIYIEPDIDNYDLCTKNYALNHMSYAIGVNKALCYDGTISFNSELPNDSKRIDDKGGNITLPAIGFSTLYDEQSLNHVDLLKLDIEGGEWFLFTEENRDYFAKTNLIIMEYHVFHPEKESLDIIKNYFSEDFSIQVLKSYPEGGLVMLEKRAA